MWRLGLAALLCALALGPAGAADYDWGLPDWMPPPPVPADNPMSAAKVELGRRLFFDSRLSAPNYLTCAHCHKPEQGFADSRPFSFGMSGQRHPRNTPGLANVGYLSPLGWVDPDVRDLESQVLVPLFNTSPVEMMASGMAGDIARRLEADRAMRERFAAAFPETGGGSTSWRSSGRSPPISGAS
ncbi:MAG: cytochrome-c peroxidase [Geminicoccaceae bacterium]